VKRLLMTFVICFVLVGLMAVPAMAAPGTGNGAVKGDLLDYNGVYGAGAAPVVVGWFDVNATGNGVLRVVVNLDSAAEAADMTDLTIRVIIRKQGALIPNQINTNYVEAISTNGQGQGNAIIMQDISGLNPDLEYIEVMVFVNPGGMPDLFEGAANLAVQLKK